MSRDQSGDERYHREAKVIFAFHGPADALTTVAAARSVGPHVEANPIIRDLLGIGPAATVVGMCTCVAVAAALWPVAADSLDAPPAAAASVAAVGAAVVAGNLAVILA
jgi:capsular polysaccharide biosynthesis protein